MLTSKQRAYLKSLASNEDTILIVGKNGVNSQVVKQLDDALIARELIKGKVLEACDKDVKSIANELAEEVGAEVVQVIGGKFIIYRKNDDDVKIILPRDKKSK